jgi:hypothetical protein
MTWIEVMSLIKLSRPATSLEQVFLIERDAGLLCRILGLYAARSLDVVGMDFAYAAQDVMKLQVSVADTLSETADVVRVLVDKVSTFIGVLAACEQDVEQRRAV